MNTINLVDPELRDALALWPRTPLTADFFSQRRANWQKVIAAALNPELPGIAVDEIRVESMFRANPIGS